METKNDKYQDLKELFAKEFTKKIELIINKDQVKEQHKEVMTEKKEQLANRVLYSPNLSELEDDLSDISSEKLDNLRKEHYTTEYASKEFETYSELEEMYLEQVEIEGIQAEMDNIEAELQQSLQSSIDQTRSFQKTIEDKIKENNDKIAEKEAEIAKLRKLDEERIANREFANNENLIDEILLDVEYLKLGNVDLQKRSDIAEDFLTKYGSLEALREAIKNKELKEEENIKNNYLYDEKRIEYGYFDDWVGKQEEQKATEPAKIKTTKTKSTKNKSTKTKSTKTKTTKTEPVKTEPVKTEPAKTEPVKTEPVKTEPTKTDPAKAEPVKTEPVKTDPAKAEPVKTEPAKAAPIKTEPAKAAPVKTDPAKTTSKETSIYISPIENVIRFHSDLKDVELKKLNYNKEYTKSIFEKLKEESPEYDWNSVKKSIDPHIVATIMLNSNGKKEFDNIIGDYFDLLNGIESDLKIEYNLKDIYKSDLRYRQIRNLQKIVKAAQKNSMGNINVEKDGLGKRFFGNIKKRIESVKLLGDGKEKDKETKPRLIDKLRARKVEHKKRDKDISKAKSLGARIGNGAKNVATGARVIGTRLSGQLRGEQTAITEMKVQNIRNSSVKGSQARVTTEESNVTNQEISSDKPKEEVITESNKNNQQVSSKETPEGDIDDIIKEAKVLSNGADVKKNLDVDEIIEEFGGNSQEKTGREDGVFSKKYNIDHQKAHDAVKSKGQKDRVIIEHPDGSKDEGTRL